MYNSNDDSKYQPNKIINSIVYSIFLSIPFHFQQPNTTLVLWFYTHCAANAQPLAIRQKRAQPSCPASVTSK